MSPVQKPVWDRRRVVRAAAAGSLTIVFLAVIARWSTGLSATYFDDDRWDHEVYSVVDREIDSDALTANAPVSPDQPFSVRWFGYFHAPRSGTYAFRINAAGSAGLSIDQPGPGGTRVFSVVTDAVDLVAGPHPISVSYSHRRGRYGIDLAMSVDGGPWTTIKSTDLAPHPRSRFAVLAIATVEWAGVIVVAVWLLFVAFWLGRRLPAALTIPLTTTTLLMVLAVIYDSPQWIRGPAPYPTEWQWDYHSADAILRIGPSLLGATGVIAAIAFLSSTGKRSNTERQARLGLIAAMLAGFVLDVGVLHLGQGGALAGVASATRNDLSTGYFSVAAQHTSTTLLLTNYSQMLVDLPVHARTHPPGPILYYQAFIKTFEAMPGWAGGLVTALERGGVPINRFAGNRSGDTAPVLAAAAVAAGVGTVFSAVLICWPIARIASAGGADPLTASRAGALWALCPAGLFFLPTFDAVGTLLIAVVTVLGCSAAVTRQSWRASAYALAAGVVSGGALFSSLGAAPMLVAAAVTAVVATIRESNWRRLTSVALLALVGLLAAISVPVSLGFDVVGTVQGVMHLHRDHYTPPGRALWLRFNLLDFSIFLGWPVAAWLIIRAARDRNWWTARLVLAMTAVIVVLDVADVTRSEVGRLWMPLMPMIFAATGIATSNPNTRREEWILVAALLAIVSLTLALHWSP